MSAIFDAVVEIELAERQRGLFERRAIGRWPAAVARQQLGELESVDHRRHARRIDRQHAQRGVLGELDQDAAGADQQHRAIERIAARADDRLDAGHHLLHQETVDARIGLRLARRCNQALGRAFHLSAVPQIERDAAGFGLVQDVGGVDFQHHREADALGGGSRLGRARDLRDCGNAMP